MDNRLTLRTRSGRRTHAGRGLPRVLGALGPHVAGKARRLRRFVAHISQERTGMRDIGTLVEESLQGRILDNVFR